MKANSDKCSGVRCKFLQLNKHQWSNPIMPKVDKKLFPFYYATKSGGKLWINVNVNSSQQVCFQFHYWAPLNASLRILYQETQGLDLGHTFNSKEKWFPDSKDKLQKICTSDIEKYDSHNNLIGFENTNIVALRIEKEEQLIGKTPEKLLPYLTIFDENHNVSNQWSLKHPQINPECLRLSEDNPNEILFNGWGKDNFNRKSYLISNMIKNDNKYKSLGFNFSKIMFPEDLRIKVVLFDKELKIIQNVISIKNSDLHIVPNETENVFNYKNLNFTNLSTEFRIGFIIEYTNPSTSFSLKNVNVNDPCITNENKINTCNNKNGTCEIRDAKAFCKCNSEYTGENCETKNWCNVTNSYKEFPMDKTGNEICKSMNNSKSCNYNQNAFYCECEKDYFWDDSKHNCRSIPGCLNTLCGQNEICIDDTKCVCAQFFVNINHNKNKSELNCQKFDWCKKDHIEFIKDLDYDTKYKTDCKFKCEKMDDDEHGLPQRMCSCPSGTVKTETECRSFKCSFTTMNDCQQICTNNKSIPDGFKCDCIKPLYELNKNNECVWKNATDKCPCKSPAFCDEKMQCKCRENYEYIEGNCEPNIKAFEELNSDVIAQTCPGGFSKNKTELICDCNGKTELNAKTKVCEPKAFCAVGSSMFELCKNRSAICTYDEMKNPICECLPGQWFHNNNKITGVCVGLCELDDNIKLIKRKYCETKNANCDPFSGQCVCKPGLFQNNISKECEASLMTVEFKIFIKNIDSLMNYPHISPISRINLMRFKRAIDENDHFYNDEDYKNTYQTNLNKKKEILSNKDVKLSATQTILQKNLFDVIMMANKDFTINDVTFDSCVMKDKTLDCNILLALPAQYSKESFSKYLKNSCHPNGKDCFFYQNNKVLFTVDTTSFDLNKISDFKPCGKNRCDSYADCIAKNGSYSCQCNDFFSVTSTKTLNVRHGDHQVLQLCKMKELCNTKCGTKTTENMSCRQTTFFNETQQKWSADPECICAKNYNLVTDNKNQRHCSGVCKDINCNNHGKCQFKGVNGFACLCDDGWSGELCDTEHKIALGGWIAGIVILALLVVVVSGIAFVFYRRSSNGGYSGSGHQMDDYSGQSFRTQQSRGPSHGSDNPAFHRN